jgi:hypothetical protein
MKVVIDEVTCFKKATYTSPVWNSRPLKFKINIHTFLGICNCFEIPVDTFRFPHNIMHRLPLTLSHYIKIKYKIKLVYV